MGDPDRRVMMNEEISNIINWTERKMQFALTSRNQLFDFTRYSVVPNVSWGLLNYEVDLLCLSKSGVFHEVEIKISKRDMVADNRKRWNHKDPKIGRLWFAYPMYLVKSILELVPEWAGIVGVEVYLIRGKFIYNTKILKRPRPKKRVFETRKPDEQEIISFLRLGVIRMWSDRSYRDEALGIGGYLDGRMHEEMV